MKNNLKAVLGLTLVILFSLTAFLGGSFLYLKQNADKSRFPTETKVESVPYRTDTLRDKNLLFVLPDETRLLFGLKFSEERLDVVFSDRTPHERYCGSVPDFTVKTDYETISELIDRFGGVTLSDGESEIRYTGLQIMDLFSEQTDYLPLLTDVVAALLAQIAKNGMTADDFVFLITNTETDLTVPDCFDWATRMDALCRNPHHFYCNVSLPQVT